MTARPDDPTIPPATTGCVWCDKGHAEFDTGYSHCIAPRWSPTYTPTYTRRVPCTNPKYVLKRILDLEREAQRKFEDYQRILSDIKRNYALLPPPTPETP